MKQEIAFRSGNQVCWCLPENARICPLRKDRDCVKGLLDVDFCELSEDELSAVESVRNLSKEVDKLSDGLDSSSRIFNKSMKDIDRSIKRLKRK